MSSGRNVPIASVYGDTGTVEASYQKDMTQLGSDPYLRVVTNSGEFNLFQQFTLSDNFYDSRFEEVYVTQNSAGASNPLSLASLQFNTMGWTRTDRMYLQIPIVMNQIAFSDSALNRMDGSLAALSWTRTNIVDPNFYDFFTYMGKGGLTSGDETNVNQILPALQGGIAGYVCNMFQVDWALMHVFNRIAIYGGNNNQPIGRTQSFFLEGLKTQLREIPYNDNSINTLAQLGLPVSVTSAVTHTTTSLEEDPTRFIQIPGNSSYPVFTSPSGFFNPLVEDVPDKWRKKWASTFLNCSSKIMGGDWQKGKADPPNNGDDEQYALYNQTQYNIVLPLSYINNFFRHRTYLPPDFKLKIDVEGVPQTVGPVNVNCPIIAACNGNQFCGTKLLADENYPWGWNFTAGINFSQIKLIYQNHTLRQPIQAQINEKWLSFPIVYNYETYEIYDVDNSGNNSTTMIVRDIAISQQRPTQLMIQIVDQVTQGLKVTGGSGAVNNFTTFTVDPVPLQKSYTINPTYTTEGSSSAHGTLWWGTSIFNMQMADNSIDTPPVTVTGALSAIHAQASRILNDGSANISVNRNYPVITNISTLIGGRTQYYYKNDQFTQYRYGPHLQNAYDLLIAEQDEECYLDYSTTTKTKTPIEFTTISGIGSFQRITIAPGGYVNTADIPTDLGATVIRVQIQLSSPLPKEKKIQIVKKLPEQIAVDTNKNCTLIMWPAIKSNNGFSVPNVVNSQ